MQVSTEKLAAQQLVLFHLGFYRGTVDGIWSNATIEAKKKFEADITFLPAYPNGGLPFGERDKLPKGWRYGAKGVIGHADLTPEKTAELLKEHEGRVNASAQRAAIKASEGSVQPQPVGSDGPGVVTETAKDAADTQVNEKTADPQEQPAAPVVDAQRSLPNSQQRPHHQKGNR